MTENNEMVMDMETKNQQFDEDVEQILELLESSNYFKAREMILKYNEVDIAEILEFIMTRDSRINFHELSFDSFAFFQR